MIQDYPSTRESWYENALMIASEEGLPLDVTHSMLFLAFPCMYQEIVGTLLSGVSQDLLDRAAEEITDHDSYPAYLASCEAASDGDDDNALRRTPGQDHGSVRNSIPEGSRGGSTVHRR